MQGSRFQVPGSKLRRGVTIMEVLFAIMVTGIGLLAALTLLPVAARQAQKIAERLVAIVWSHCASLQSVTEPDICTAALL